MSWRNFLFNFTVGSAALLLGLGWVSVFHFFGGNGLVANPDPAEAEMIEKFDINDPNSVLPLDYKNEELSDPKAEETNEAMFDPEGIYKPDEDLMVSIGLQDFNGFVIANKNFDVECDNKNFGNPIPPHGHAVVSKTALVKTKDAMKLAVDPAKGSKDPYSEYDRNYYPSFEKLSVGIDSVFFTTEETEGVYYEFSGKFLKRGNFYTLDPKAIVIDGNLIKYENGKKSAEGNLKFTWSPDEMCHC